MTRIAPLGKTPILKIRLTAVGKSLMKTHRLSEPMIFELVCIYMRSKAMVNMQQVKPLLRRELVRVNPDGSHHLTQAGARLLYDIVENFEGIDHGLIYFKLNYKIIYPD